MSISSRGAGRFDAVKPCSDDCCIDVARELARVGDPAREMYHSMIKLGTVNEQNIILRKQHGKTSD